MSLGQNSTARPDVGSLWIWEPDNLRARCVVRVAAVEWNGEEWWVSAEIIEPAPPFIGPDPAPFEARVGERRWNELDRFLEAAVISRP